MTQMPSLLRGAASQDRLMRHGAGLSDRRTVTAMRNPRADDHEDQARRAFLANMRTVPI